MNCERQSGTVLRSQPRARRPRLYAEYPPGPWLLLQHLWRALRLPWPRLQLGGPPLQQLLPQLPVLWQHAQPQAQRPLLPWQCARPIGHSPVNSASPNKYTYKQKYGIADLGSACSLFGEFGCAFSCECLLLILTLTSKLDLEVIQRFLKFLAFDCCFLQTANVFFSATLGVVDAQCHRSGVLQRKYTVNAQRRNAKSAGSVILP